MYITCHCFGRVSISKLQASMAVEIFQFIQRCRESEEFGKVMAVTRETSWFGDCLMAVSFDDFRVVGRRKLQRVRKAHRHLHSWSSRLARAHFRLEQKLWYQELPESETNDGRPTGESDSDDFHYGALMYRNDQRGQLFQTTSPVSTPAWCQWPDKSWNNHWWEHSQSSWGQTDEHASWRQGS